MFLKVVVFHLTDDDSEYLVKQYSQRGLKAVAFNGTVTLETEDTFERCMIYMAIGQQFPDYEVYMRQKK